MTVMSKHVRIKLHPLSDFDFAVLMYFLEIPLEAYTSRYKGHFAFMMHLFDRAESADSFEEALRIFGERRPAESWVNNQERLRRRLIAQDTARAVPTSTTTPTSVEDRLWALLMEDNDSALTTSAPDRLPKPATSAPRRKDEDASPDDVAATRITVAHAATELDADDDLPANDSPLWTASLLPKTPEVERARYGEYVAELERLRQRLLEREPDSFVRPWGRS